jgi:hypothetical protein
MFRIAACLFGAAIAFVLCSQPTSAQKGAETGKSSLKSRIAPADPAKYRSIIDGQAWKNPCLIVQAKGIDLRNQLRDKGPDDGTRGGGCILGEIAVQRVAVWFGRSGAGGRNTCERPTATMPQSRKIERNWCAC